MTSTPKRNGRPPKTAVRDRALELFASGLSLDEVRAALPGASKASLCAWKKAALENGTMPPAPVDLSALDSKSRISAATALIKERQAELLRIDVAERNEQLIAADTVHELLRSVGEKFPPFMDRLLNTLPADLREAFVVAGTEFKAAIDREQNAIIRKAARKEGK